MANEWNYRFVVMLYKVEVERSKLMKSITAAVAEETEGKEENAALA